MDCEKKGGEEGAMRQSFLERLRGESFIHTLAVRFMSQEDNHSVYRRKTSIFDIFIRSPVRQTQ